MQRLQRLGWIKGIAGASPLKATSQRMMRHMLTANGLLEDELRATGQFTYCMHTCNAGATRMKNLEETHHVVRQGSQIQTAQRCYSCRYKRLNDQRPLTRKARQHALNKDMTCFV